MNSNQNSQSSTAEESMEAPSPINMPKVDEKTDLSSKTPEEIGDLMKGNEIQIQELSQQDIEESLKNTPLSIHGSKLDDYTQNLHNQFEAGKIDEEEFADGLSTVNEQLGLLNNNLKRKKNKENENDEKNKVEIDRNVDRNQAEQIMLIIATLIRSLKAIGRKMADHGQENKDTKLAEQGEALASNTSELEENASSFSKEYQKQTRDQEHSSPSPNQ